MKQTLGVFMGFLLLALLLVWAAAYQATTGPQAQERILLTLSAGVGSEYILYLKPCDNLHPGRLELKFIDVFHPTNRTELVLSIAPRCP
jgi:hypothetical protein